jgi:hypothetical protein
MQAHAKATTMVAMFTLCCLGGTFGAGCAGTAPLAPADVTRAQIERLTASDEAGAAALLTPKVRVKAPQWPAPADLPSAGSVAEVERTAMWAGTRELELVRMQGGWAIRRGVLALFRVDSAEGALAAFGRALEARDTGLVLALMPEESRRLLSPAAFGKAFAAREAAWRELGRAIGAQRVAWAVRDVERAEAVVTVGEGKAAAEQRVVLVREAGGWKVFDVQPWSGYIAP